MNKFGIVLGAAAVMTLAGCKDPDYKYATASSQGEAKNVETENSFTATTEPMSEKMVETAPAATCQCPPGTKHETPCKCGAADCKCVVETKAVATTFDSDYTEYIVQEGDYLSKISQRYNVTLSSIRRLNPSIKKDVIRVGQKIKLPGKVDVGVQKAPAKASAAVKTAKKSGSTAAYTGATKEYVVKNGDTLGSIAYGNGLNIRQLKQLNGLTADSLKIGQKLKIPAEKVAKTANKAAPVVDTRTTPAAAPAVAEPPAKVDEVVAPVNEVAPVAPATEVKPEAAPAPVAAATTASYVVQEGDDMTGVSIRWGVSAAEIRELNNLGENDQLVPGQIIKLPAEAQQ